MCGFAGLMTHGGVAADECGARLRAMGDTLAHRGPDDSGAWLDAAPGIGLVHRRLAVVDLSPAGHQPMRSVSGRLVLVFNGEIYNHAELRSRLGRTEWRGTSDTETLLAAIEAWGVEEALARTIGMFAFAVWDRHERSLTLARDRLGEKPLYYGWQQRTFLFASELKALRVHPAFQGQLDHAAIEQYLAGGYITGARSIYAGISKLPPGSWLRLAGDATPGTLSPPRAYWSVAQAASRGVERPFQGTAAEAADELERRLRRAVHRQLMADVPLGAFLSGGVDSSTIVALMQVQTGRPVRTFTIGFAEREYDESPHADLIARHLETQHTSLKVTPEQARSVIPSLPEYYDEPFGDSSAIPTVLVSRLARSAVTVALSGDGGDELFGGYNRYPTVLSLWQHTRRLPGPLRALAARAALLSPAFVIDAVMRPVIRLRGRKASQPPAVRAQRLGRALAHDRELDFYSSIIAQWLPAPTMAAYSSGEHGRYADVPAGLPFREQMMLFDSVTYLPDDILVKVDRAAMSVSLETRVPMLDHEVVEFAWSLSPQLRNSGAGTKAVLRDVLSRHVPRHMFERPKMGFGVPVDRWIRGPLRDWADDLLAPDTIRRHGILDSSTVQRRWQEHRSGAYDWRDPLWVVLMLQAWLESSERRTPKAA